MAEAKVGIVHRGGRAVGGEEREAWGEGEFARPAARADAADAVACPYRSWSWR